MPVIYNLSLPDQGIIILKSQGFSGIKWGSGYRIDLKTTNCQTINWEL